jgi:hypothetical protein
MFTGLQFAVGTVADSGSVSIGYALVITLAIVGFSVSTLIAILLGSLNTIKADIKGIREELHNFIAKQNGINATLEERTKDL